MKRVTIIIATIAFSIGGYFLYSFFMRKSTAELWTLIPDSAFAVVEVTESDDEWEDLKESKLCSFLEGFSFYQQVKSKVEFVNTTLENSSDYNLFDILGDKTLLFSFHKDDAKGVDVIMYLPLKPDDNSYVKSIRKVFKGDPKFLIQEKKHTGNKYFALSFLETNENLFFQEFNGVFIASFSEEIFQETVKGRLDPSNFKKGKIALLKTTHEEEEIETENINIFIDYASFSEALAGFINEDSRKVLIELSSFASHSFFGLSLDDDVATLSGFTSCSDSTISYLSVYDDQEANKEDWTNKIPLNAVSVNLVSISDALAYSDKIVSYGWNKKEGEDRAVFEFLELVSGDVLFVNALSSTGDVDKILVYKTEDSDKAFEWLKEESTGQIEDYNGHEVGLLEQSDLIGKLHGSFYSGSEVSVFTRLEDYVVLASSIPALKEYLLNLDENQTWASSESYSDDFEDHFLESNFSFYLNPTLSKKAVYDDLTSNGARLRDDIGDNIGMLQFLLFEFSSQGEKYYTDCILKLNEIGNQPVQEVAAQETKEEKQIKVLFEYVADSKITSKAFVVKNYLHRTREILVQTEDNFVHMIDETGRERWKYDLGSQLIGDVHEVDVFKNQKIQYLMATSEKVFVLDRKGHLVENYPLEFLGIKRSNRCQFLTMITTTIIVSC